MSSSQFMWHGKDRVASMLIASAVYQYYYAISIIITFIHAPVGICPLSQEQGSPPHWGLGTHTSCFLKFLLYYTMLYHSQHQANYALYNNN